MLRTDGRVFIVKEIQKLVSSFWLRKDRGQDQGAGVGDGKWMDLRFIFKTEFIKLHDRINVDL